MTRLWPSSPCSWSVITSDRIIRYIGMQKAEAVGLRFFAAALDGIFRAFLIQQLFPLLPVRQVSLQQRS